MALCRFSATIFVEPSRYLVSSFQSQKQTVLYPRSRTATVAFRRATSSNSHVVTFTLIVKCRHWYPFQCRRYTAPSWRRHECGPVVRFVVVLDQSDLIVETYAVELPGDDLHSDEAFIIAARRMAARDHLAGDHPRLRFVIAPPPNLPE
jgi:hypothetical protein